MAEEINTLADKVDEYLIMRSINKKKYYSMYLVIAKNVWRHLYQKTIYAVNSEWKTLKKGVPYDYIDMPSGVVRLFSVSTLDECGEIISLFYNNQLNTISKPATRKCGCTACDCSGLCEDVNSMVYTTTLVFTDNGTDYYEKKWVKSCANGDMIEYTETPTKKYNSFQGDTSPSDYDIVTVKSQKTLCKLTTRVCGCPEDTEENCELLNTLCGCYLPFNSCCRKKHCDHFLGAINSNKKGEVKISECGNKIYFKPHPHAKTKPEFLLVNYQTSGENCSDTVQVPEYGNEALWAGIDYYSKRYNNSYSLNEKNEAKYYFRQMENELIMYLNPLSLEWLSNVADAKILY